MKKYALYDTYETEIEPGELICTSDDYAEIVKAAKLRKAETDGECKLYVMTRSVYKEKELKDEA